MTLEELAGELPNGFHDTEFKTIGLDYDKRQAVIGVSVWIGDLDSKIAAPECYRDGELTLEGLQFMSIEPPDPRYKFSENRRLRVDLGDGATADQVVAVSAIPSDCFVSQFFVVDWNSFIQVAARDARLDWTGEVYDRSKRIATEA